MPSFKVPRAVAPESSPLYVLHLSLLILSVAACSSEEPQSAAGLEGQTCRADLTCEPGLECILGTCQRIAVSFPDGGAGKEAGLPPDGLIPEQGLPPLAPWGRSFGDAEFDLVMDLVATDDGGACICGHFKGQLNFDTYELSPRGTQHIFVACFDSQGSPRWAKKFVAEDNNATARVIAIGPDGALYITGTYEGTLKIGQSITTAQKGIYLASLDLDGTPRWIDHLGEGDTVQVDDMAISQGGTIYVAGSFQEAINIGKGSQPAAGGYDVFLTSYSRSSSDRWRKFFGSIDNDRSRAIAVDSQGSVYLAGTFMGTVDFDQVQKTTKGDQDIFLTTFSPDGVVVRVKRLGLTRYSTAFSLAVDGSGNQYLAGDYDGQIKLVGKEHTAPEKRDGFLLALDSMGNESWAKIVTSPGVASPREVSVDAAGTLHLAGLFDDAVTVDGQLLPHSSNAGLFLAEFTSAGAKVSARAFSSTGFTAPEGIAADAQGVLLTGNFRGALDLGIETFLAKGDSYDLFISRLARQ